MKILIVDNSSMNIFKGSYCTNDFNGEFVGELVRLGNEVFYFQFAMQMESSISRFDLCKAGIECIPLTKYKNKLFRYATAYLKFFRIVRKYDFVYFYYNTSFKYAAFICKLFSVRYGLYIRGMYGLDDSVSRWIYKNAFTVFTVSDHFSNFVNDIVGCKNANTIRPMIPFSEKDIVYDRVYDENKKQFEILFLARVAEDKGVRELFAAFRKLKNEGYAFHVAFVGDGEYMNKAKALISSLDMEDWIEVRGAVYDVDEKKKCFLDSDIYVLPTYHEGFPRTLYEAMIFGTPIVTTFVGGIPALMKDDFNCRKIEPRSAESIYEGLKFAMDNYSKMVEYAKNGFKTVERIVDSKRMTHAQHLNRIIQEINIKKNI